MLWLAKDEAPEVWTRCSKVSWQPSCSKHSPALVALGQQWGHLSVSLATSPRVHKACKRAQVVSCRAGEVSKPAAGSSGCRSKMCVGKKHFLFQTGKSQFLFWSCFPGASGRGVGWGGSRESIKKRFLCALETGKPQSIPVCTGVSQESHVRLQQPLCCCSLVPVGETEAGNLVLLVQNGAEGDLGCRNLPVIHGDIGMCRNEIKCMVWGGEGMKYSHPQAQLGVVHWEHRNVLSYEHWVMHKVFGLPQAPPVFLFHICCRVRAQWVEWLNSWKGKQKAPTNKKPQTEPKIEDRRTFCSVFALKSLLRLLPTIFYQMKNV